jgi:hypothetical protein
LRPHKRKRLAIPKDKKPKLEELIGVGIGFIITKSFGNPKPQKKKAKKKKKTITATKEKNS